MKVLVTGGGGQLASALGASVPENVNLTVLSIDDLDIANDEAVQATVKSHSPNVIINTAAYTAVDKAESDAAMARAVNEEGARHLAHAAAAIDARLIYPSTDFVFDGSGSKPWKPDAPKNPLSVYGSTKSAGEDAVLQELPERALVVRTAWLYASEGVNFVNNMLRLMRERDELTIVADQIGTPTWARSLAEAIWCMIDRNLTGTHHWTDLGSTSWYEFAVMIGEIAREMGILDRMPRIEPIPSSDFPTPARRPLYSVLDKTETWRALDGSNCIPPRPWHENLRTMMVELKRA